MVERHSISIQNPSSSSSTTTVSDFPHRRKKNFASKVSTEYDSEGGVFVNKLSATVFDGLAKFKASFSRGPDGSISYPLLGFVSKHLSVLYDPEDVNALVTLDGHLGNNLNVKYLVDVKQRQGELKVRANGWKDLFRADLAYDLPTTGRLPRASFACPIGEVKVEEDLREDEETGEPLTYPSITGSAGRSVLGGLLVADYANQNVHLKYVFKDEEMTLTPSVRWPEPSVSLAFKRQFDRANKFTYSYNFDSASWFGVFKHQPQENFKLKLGYDSNAHLGWGSVWIGKEDGGAKGAPRKCKVQLMVQVPEDDWQSAVVLFRVKKRWDL